MQLIFQILAAAGFLVSLYALYVRQKLLHSDSYSPACDISDRVSCSKALGSRYGTTVGIPNPLAGLVFYCSTCLLAFSDFFLPYLFFLVLPAVLFSIYLAYISYFRQKNFCLVCSFIYLVNLAMATVGFMLATINN
jgi:vitamin-K-epoxide reductase (warfarin-sensitive)